MHVRPFIITFLVAAVSAPATAVAQAVPPLAGEWQAEAPSTVRLVLTSDRPNRLEGQFISTSGTTWTVEGTVDDQARSRSPATSRSPSLAT